MTFLYLYISVISVPSVANVFWLRLCRAVTSVANLFYRPGPVDVGVRMTDDILPKNGRESWKNYP